MGRIETRPDKAKAEHMAWGSKQLRDQQLHDEAEIVENRIGYEIDLFCHAAISPQINYFYNAVIKYILRHHGGESRLIRGIENVLEATPEDRYNAYALHEKPETFEENMLKLLETIALTATEEELGSENRKPRSVLLSKDVINRGFDPYAGEDIALDNNIRAGTTLGRGKIYKTFSGAIEREPVLGRTYAVPFLPVRVTFEMVTPEKRWVGPREFHEPYVVATVSRDPRQGRRKF